MKCLLQTPRTGGWRRSFVRAVGAAVVAALGACTISTPPKLQVSGARAGTARDGRSVVFIDVVASNPNNQGLPLKRVSYQVDLGGERVFVGQRDAQACVRAYGLQKFTLPVPVSASYVQGGATRFRVRGDVTYVAPESFAQTLYENGLREWTTSFAGEGVVGEH